MQIDTLISTLTEFQGVAGSGIQMRTINDDDLSFLQILYGTTREQELTQVPWTDEQKAEFVAMQFNAQHGFYQDTFKEAAYLVISRGDENIGRLYLDLREDEVRIIDIALMPDQQKQGLGRALLESVQQLAQSRKQPITIHVEKNNPAMSLYKRLGFELIEDQGVYDLMRWNAV